MPALAALISYQLKYALSVCLALGTGVYHATKAPVCMDNEVIALFVPTFLGTSGTLPDHFPALFPQPHHSQTTKSASQAVSSVLDEWDGIFQLHPYLEAPYTTLFTSWTELRSAVLRPKLFTFLDLS